MKAIRLLGTFVISLFIFTVVKDIIPGFLDGWSSVDHPLIPGTELISLEVQPTSEFANDSLFNQTLQRNMPCQVEEIKTPIKPVMAATVLHFIAGLAALFCLYGYYCLARMLLSVSKGDILTPLNIRRLRFFIYPSIITVALFEIVNYINYQQAAHELVLTGYKLMDFHFKYELMNFFVIALLVEVFAQAVRIKEEQDLTI